MTITAYTDLRSPYTFVAKAEVYRWEEDFGVAVDWWPYTTPLEEAFGPAEGRDERQLRKIRYSYMNVRRPRRRPGPHDPGHEADLRPHARPRRPVAGQGRRRLPRLPRPRVRSSGSSAASSTRTTRPTSARRSPRRAATPTPGPGAFATAPRSWKRSIAAPRRRGSSGSRASSSTASSSGEGIRWRRSGNGLPNAPSDARSAGVHTVLRGTALGNHGGRGVSPHSGRACAAFASRRHRMIVARSECVEASGTERGLARGELPGPYRGVHRRICIKTSASLWFVTGSASLGDLR